MVSAPHSVEQTRNGKIKYGEYQTGVLTKILHDNLNCPIIIKTCNCKDDANFDENSPYKKALCEYVKQNDIKFLLDLHQLAPWRKENIDIGTGFGVNIAGYPEMSNMIKKQFELSNIDNVTVDFPFDASYPFTVSSYISAKCDIPCIQIEINSRLVCEEYNDFRFYEIEKVLERIILDLNGVELL